eukprot:Seg1388.4 transcript_id=Seg1388.4/GoldUCD/mRNA.D3Y31 product="hypothetical protein" protein_id=Seg1388.4/GoldUCD/D3Y31
MEIKEAIGTKTAEVKLLSKRLSNLSVRENDHVADLRHKDINTTTRRISSQRRGTQTRRKGKKDSASKEGQRSESLSLYNKNYETISYRIYGNPCGEGFLIEARMLKPLEDKNIKKGNDKGKEKHRRSVLYTEFIHQNETMQFRK